MAAEVLQSINRILQYNQQRDQLKVQEALGFMEMAQSKRFKELELQLKSDEMSASERYREAQVQLEKDKLGVSTWQAKQTEERLDEEQEIRKSREARLKKAEDRAGAVEERAAETFKRAKFEDSLKYLKQEQLENSAQVATTFVDKFGFQEASVMAQQEGASVDEINTNVNIALSKSAPRLSKKERQFLASEISGSLWAAGQLQTNQPLVDLLDVYHDSLDKKSRGEKLATGEKRIYEALAHFTNINDLTSLSQIANKHKIVNLAIDREEEEYRLRGDMELPEQKGDMEPALGPIDPEVKKKRIETALLSIGDLTNLKEKTILNLDESELNRQKLMTANEQRYMIQQAIQKAERVPEDQRTVEENELLLNKDAFLEEADSAVDSLAASLELIEDELNNNYFDASLNAYGSDFLTF